MQQLETPNVIVLIATLPNEWQLQCAYTDQSLTITVYKLDIPISLVEKYESVPERLQILAESLADLALLLTTSKGIQIQEKCLVIECKIGEKLKTLKIELKQKKVPQQEQILNLHQLLEKEKKQRLQEKAILEITISQVKSECNIEKYNKEQLQQKYNKLCQQCNQKNGLLSKLNVQQTTCSKYGCNNQIVFACETLHRPPIQKGNRRFICGTKCEY